MAIYKNYRVKNEQPKKMSFGYLGSLSGGNSLNHIGTEKSISKKINKQIGGNQPHYGRVYDGV